MKKKILTTLSVVLVLALAALGILAYLSDTDSDVNVMTLGNVKIDQIEQEWKEGELVGFTQAKPLYPYVGDIAWENKDAENGGAYRTFAMNNVVDKYVSVKNTGKSDAYVRTFIALEMGDYSYEDFNMVGVSINKLDGDEFDFPGTWQWTDDFVANIDGKNYNVMVAVHEDAVKPGETTIPSLLQVYLSKDATNETVEKLDGNDNGTYDILVLSQAVQVEGFDDAVTALETAFPKGTNNENVAGWFEGAEFTTPVIANSSADLVAALKSNSPAICLGSDITVTHGDETVYGQHLFLANAKSKTIDLNGHNITIAEDATHIGSVFSVANGGKLVIKGDGDVEVKNGKAFIGWTINGGDSIEVYGGNYSGNGDIGGNALFYVQEQTGKIDIYGGTYTYSVADNDNWGFNVHNSVGEKVVIKIHEGALLQHDTFQYGDGSRIQLAEGCELKAVDINGVTWHQVVKK